MYAVYLELRWLSLILNMYIFCYYFLTVQITIYIAFIVLYIIDPEII